MLAAESTAQYLLGGQDAYESVHPLLREAVRRGLPFASLKALAVALKREPADVAALIGIPERTFQRRKGAVLTAPESDRLVRVARVVSQAFRVIGDCDRALEWLDRDNKALGGHPPLSLLDTDLGAHDVQNTLQRIEFGVFG